MNGFVGSYVNSVFNILRNWQSFPKAFNTTSSTVMNVDHDFCTHLLSNTCYFAFLKIIVILMNINWHFTVIQISIFLVTSDIKNVFMCLPLVYLIQWHVYSYTFLIWKFHYFTKIQQFRIWSRFKSVIRYAIYKYFLPFFSLILLEVLLLLVLRWEYSMELWDISLSQPS